MNNNIQKAVIYCRVSSAKQTLKGDGLNYNKPDAENMLNIRAMKLLRYSVMILLAH